MPPHPPPRCHTTTATPPHICTPQVAPIPSRGVPRTAAQPPRVAAAHNPVPRWRPRPRPRQPASPTVSTLAGHPPRRPPPPAIPCGRRCSLSLSSSNLGGRGALRELDGPESAAQRPSPANACRLRRRGTEGGKVFSWAALDESLSGSLG
jgi:hypothetical protein